MEDYTSEFEHEAAGLVLKINPDLRQKHIEEFELELLKLPHLTGRHTSSQRGAAIRAAIAADWVIDPKAEKLIAAKSKTPRYMLAGEDVGDMSSRVVSWYGQCISNVYEALITIPPFLPLE